MKYALFVIAFLVGGIVAAQEFSAKPEPLSQVEQAQLATAKQRLADAQAAVDKAVKDYDAAILDVVKKHGYDKTYLVHRPGSPTPYVTLTDKKLILHEACADCQ